MARKRRATGRQGTENNDKVGTNITVTKKHTPLFSLLFSRSGSDQRIVTTLMRYCILPSQTPNAADIHAFHEMAIRSLVRRLRRNQERCALDNLVRAIQTGDRETGCIRIPRSLDGRMQVRQKKTIPHVLYCQIWRWNDLKTYHELQGIVTCRYAYGKISMWCSKSNIDKFM